MTTDNSDEDVFRIPSQLTGVVIGLMGGAILILASLFYSDGLGRVIAITTVVAITTIVICWPLKRKAWFWTYLTIVILLHIAAGWNFDVMREYHDGFTLVPVMMIDILIILSGVSLLANRRSKQDRN